MSRLFHIDVVYACFGIEATNGTITMTAPIADWMKGKKLEEVKPWLLKRKAKVTEIRITTNLDTG